MRRIAILVVLSASTLIGQTGQVGYWSGFCSSTVENAVLPNAACGPTTAQVPFYAAGGFCFAPPFFPLGGHGIDQLHDLIYTCDGTTVYVSADPLYVAAPCAGPFPGASFPVPAATQSSGAPFRPVTGLCVGLGAWPAYPSSPCPDILFVTDGVEIMAFDPRGANAIVILPWPATLTIPGRFLTGLEYDDETATIWATDDGGNCYEYSPFGAPVSGPHAPNLPVLLSNIVGNVVDRSTCGREIYVTDGFALYPVVNTFSFVLLAAPAFFIPYGASFSAEPLLMPGACGSFCAPNPIIGTTEPVASGTTAPKTLAFTLTGAPPTTTAVLAFDFACTGGIGLPPSCTFWLPPTFLWFYTFTGITTAGGSLSTPGIPLPLAACPGLVGLTGYAQWFYLDACSAIGFGMTDALHLRLSSL